MRELVRVLVLLASVRGARADEIVVASHVALVDGGFTNGRFGEAIPFELEARVLGVRSWSDRAWFVAWDAGGGPVVGYAGNQHPGFAFGGGAVATQGDLGMRFAPAARWSP